MQAKNARCNFFKKAFLTGMAAMTVPFSGTADQAGHLYNPVQRIF